MSITVLIFMLVVINLSAGTIDIGCLSYYKCVQEETGLTEDFSNWPTLCQHQDAAIKCYDKPKTQFCYTVSHHLPYSPSENTLRDRLYRNCSFFHAYGEYVLCAHNVDTAASRALFRCLTQSHTQICQIVSCSYSKKVEAQCSSEEKEFIKSGYLACKLSGAQQNMFEKIVILLLIVMCRIFTLFM